jgi:hypothetical protein
MRARPLPPNAPPRPGQPHALPRDPEAMPLFQGRRRERGGPHGCPIPQRAGGVVNDPIKQWVNNLIGGPGPAAAVAIPEPPWEIKPPAFLKARAPVKDRAPTHSQALRDFSGPRSRRAPQHGWRAAQHLRGLRTGGYLFYPPPPSLVEAPSPLGCSSAPSSWDEAS